MLLTLALACASASFAPDNDDTGAAGATSSSASTGTPTTPPVGADPEDYPVRLVSIRTYDRDPDDYRAGTVHSGVATGRPDVAIYNAWEMSTPCCLETEEHALAIEAVPGRPPAADLLVELDYGAYEPGVATSRWSVILFADHLQAVRLYKDGQLADCLVWAGSEEDLAEGLERIVTQESAATAQEEVLGCRTEIRPFPTE